MSSGSDPLRQPHIDECLLRWTKELEIRKQDIKTEMMRLDKEVEEREEQMREEAEDRNAGSSSHLKRG